MLQVTGSTYYPEGVRTPFAGIVVGYVAACSVVPLIFAVFGTAPALLPDKVLNERPDFSAFHLIYPILLICLPPFVGFRWMLTAWKPYRIWKHALAGAVTGTAISVLLVGASVWMVALFSISGAFSGATSFLVESQSRRLRLRWMLATQAAFPEWEGGLTEELEKVRGLRP